MIKNKLPKIRNIAVLRKGFIYLILFLGIFSGGYLLGIKGFQVKLDKARNVEIVRQLPPDKNTLNFSLFWQVWDTLDSSYFDQSKLDPTAMVYGAIQGMVSSIGDPYTVFLPPEENKVVQEDLSSSFDGVGIQIGYKGTQLAVVAPLPGSPADKVGIKAGDYIIGIKDEEKNLDIGTVGISLQEAVKDIRGKAGTTVTLTILRGDSSEPLVFDVVRETVDVPTVVYSVEGDNKDIAYVRLLKFGEDTQTEWDKTVREILKDPSIKGMILDLRNNPGGYLQGAVDIAADFVKNGSTVVVEERGNGDQHQYKTDKMGLLPNMPVVLLVNGGSASASEILAGALRDINKTKLVGDVTFGKGTIQEPLDIGDSSNLHITIAKWLTPSGYWVNEKGLEPDYSIADDTNTSEDEQLQKALEVLKAVL